MRNPLVAFCFGMLAATSAPAMAQSATPQDQPAPAERTAAQAKGSPIEGPAVRMQSAAGASTEQLDAQFEALREIEDIRLTYDGRGIPRHLRGRTPYVVPSDLTSSSGRAALETVLAQLRPILLAQGTEELVLAGEPSRLAHLRTIQFEQSIRGIPVSDGKLALTVDDRIGRVAMISAKFLPDRGLPKAPSVSAAEAAASAVRWLQAKAALRARDVKRAGGDGGAPADTQVITSVEIRTSGVPELSYRIGQVEQEAPPTRLVWTVRVEAPGLGIEAVIVDAIDGAVIGTHDTRRIVREVYNSNNTNAWGTLVRTEGQSPTADPPVNNVYDNLAWALSAIEVVGSTTLTSAKFRLAVRNLSAGAGSADANTSWDSVAGDYRRDLRFGPGVPGSLTTAQTHVGNALDAVAHELSHIVAMRMTTLQCGGPTCGFTGRGLDEGFADVAGIVADMSFSRPQPWLLGEDVWASGLAYRNAAAPLLTSFGSRDWWPQRSLRTAEEGGAHDNATILSHAYYLLLNGGYHYRAGVQGIPSILVPSLGRLKAERIFYGTLLQGNLADDATFLDAKSATRSLALTLYGQPEYDAVTAAWEAVGVVACTQVPAVPLIQTELGCPWWTVRLYPVTGATTYHSQVSPNGSFSPATSFHDSPDTSDCQVYPYTWALFRARACNACGCSGWSATAYAYPWEGECP